MHLIPRGMVTDFHYVGGHNGVAGHILPDPIGLAGGHNIYAHVGSQSLAQLHRNYTNRPSG